jgi:hypothetical protein
MFARQTSAYSIARTNMDLFRTLDTGKKLKIAAKILAGNYKYVSRFFLEQQKVRNRARSAVAEVVQQARSELDGRTSLTSYEAYSAVLSASRRSTQEGGGPPAIPPKILDRALQEGSWEVTFGTNESARGLFAMRASEPDDESKHFPVEELKTDELGDEPDGSELPPHIHKLAEPGNSKKDELTKRLTDLLEAAKNCPTQEGSSMPENEALMEILKSHADTLRELVKILPAKPHKDWFLSEIKQESSPETVANTFIGAYGDVFLSRTTFVEFVEKTLAELLHPALELALAAARECPTFSIDPGFLDHKYILKMFRDFFDLFSSAELWSDKNLKGSLSKYYGLGLSIVALDKAKQKNSLSNLDVLKKKLKDLAVLTADEALKKKISGAYKEHDKIFAGFGRKKPEDVLFEVSKVVADHYITGGILKLTSKQIEDSQKGIRDAKNLNEVIEVLEKAFFDVINGKVDREQFFQPLEDLASRQQQ